MYVCIYGLSDHEAQLLVIYKIHKQAKEDHIYFKRKINKYHIADFQLNLSYESWGMVFDENDVNKAFNISLNIFLRIYYHSFPLMQTNKESNRNSWITPEY
jgi:hypothetical protein